MILVTGGTGLLGAHLLFELCQQESQVKAIKRKTSSTALTEKIFGFYHPQPQDLLAKIEWVEADITDYFSLETVMREVTQVYHCAALVSFRKKDAEAMLHINAKGTENVVNACLEQHVQKLIYVSSIAALGRADNEGMVNENSPWKESKQNSAYGISKYRAEREVWRGIAEGLDAVIVNPSVILGAGDWHKGSAELFGFVNKGLKHYTKGINGYVYVKDVCRIMTQLMQSDINGERFVVNAENLSYQQLFEKIALAMDKTPPSKELSPKAVHAGRYLYAIKDLLQGKAPRITKQMAKNAISIFRYDNQKLLKAINFNYTPIKVAVKEIAEVFKREEGN